MGTDMPRRSMTMIDKVKLTLIGIIVVSSIAPLSAAFAQSAYTTGTAASDAAAGYPSPYGSGRGFYAYVPSHVFGRSAHGRSPWAGVMVMGAPRVVKHDSLGSSQSTSIKTNLVF